MHTLASEDREALRASVRRLMADASDEAAVRSVMETERGYDAAVWKALAQMGVVGIVVDDEFIEVDRFIVLAHFQ